MGIYHLMGLGKSVGAVTTAFSYMAACRQKGGEAVAKLFGLSGEEAESDRFRGAVQALVLFTTPDVRHGKEKCEQYTLNMPGQVRGEERESEAMERALRRILHKELATLNHPNKEVELYWCDIELYRPTLTFERVARVLASAKASGAEGKEVWINLTGGTNILNAALQLAASLSRSPSRTYYLLTRNPACARHTVAQHDLGGPDDHFWVDLPVVYLSFSHLHRQMLEELATMPDNGLTARQLFERLRAIPEMPTLLDDAGALSSQEFLHLFIQPLVAQQLVIRLPEDKVAIGPAWGTLQRYFDAIPAATETVPALCHLPRTAPDWFFKAEPLEVG